MVHHLYFLMRLFPFIAVAVGGICIQVAIHFHRRKNKKAKRVFLGLAGFCGLCALLWLGFRGDRNSDLWVGRLIKSLTWSE